MKVICECTSCYNYSKADDGCILEEIALDCDGGCIQCDLPEEAFDYSQLPRTTMKIKLDGSAYLPERAHSTVSIDLSNENISENYIKAIDLVDYLPENIVPVSSNMQVNATMKFEIYEVRTFDISTEDIVVENLASKRSCTFKEDFISLELKGTKSALDSVSIDSIICTLNTKDCKRGTFNKAISITGLPENVVLNSEAVIEFTIK